jgi:hypothetical protein
VRFVTVLWHGERPAGNCVFASGPRTLAQRNRFFGIRGTASALSIRALDRQLLMLARVVIHPAYRGAGIAAAFVRRSCECAPRPWIEAQAEMGWVNPFFEKAGFVRVGSTPASERSQRRHSDLYGGGRRKYGHQRLVSGETFLKSRFAEPVYYVFDNRARDRSAAR